MPGSGFPQKFALGSKQAVPDFAVVALEDKMPHCASLHPKISTVPVGQLVFCFQPDCCSSLYFFVQVGEPAVHIQGQEPLTASMLAAAPPQEQKQMIGGCPGCQRSSCLCVHGQMDLHVLGNA